MKKIVVVFIALFLAGCSGGHQQFYKAIIDAKSAKNVKKVRLLRPGEEPKVYTTNNFDRDLRNMASNC